MLFRSHKEFLSDSMKTVVETPQGFNEFKEFVSNKFFLGEVKFSYIGYDVRNNWDTYCVLINDVIIGFTNGIFPDVEVSYKWTGRFIGNLSNR